MDADGHHVQPARLIPESVSFLVSHLWGWSPSGSLVRIRLDQGHACVATLHVNLETTVGDGERMPCRVATGITFRQPEGRTAGLRLADGTDAGVLDRTIEIWTALADDVAPMDFVRIT